MFDAKNMLPLLAHTQKEMLRDALNVAVMKISMKRSKLNNATKSKFSIQHVDSRW